MIYTFYCTEDEIKQLMHSTGSMHGALQGVDSIFKRPAEL
jgi:hypothetical protein